MRTTTNNTHTREAFEAAKFIGIVGFGSGFIGPFFVHPGSPQGPLFGIIISGPLSFVFGLFIGYLPAIFSPLKKIRPEVLKFIRAIICFAVTAILDCFKMNLAFSPSLSFLLKIDLTYYL